MKRLCVGMPRAPRRQCTLDRIHDVLAASFSVPGWLRVAAAMFAVGWGANQFAAMLQVYRDEDGASAEAVTALFGAYAFGLIPALLIFGPISDRIGRRRIMRPVLVLSTVATVILIVGGDQMWLLLLGRLAAGVASGAAFAPGTAWIKELSADHAPGTGARRATLALSGGFGSGPLVAGSVRPMAPGADSVAVPPPPRAHGRGDRLQLECPRTRHPPQHGRGPATS